MVRHGRELLRQLLGDVPHVGAVITHVLREGRPVGARHLAKGLVQAKLHGLHQRLVGPVHEASQQLLLRAEAHALLEVRADDLQQRLLQLWQGLVTVLGRANDAAHGLNTLEVQWAGRRPGPTGRQVVLGESVCISCNHLAEDLEHVEERVVCGECCALRHAPLHRREKLRGRVVQIARLEAAIICILVIAVLVVLANHLISSRSRRLV
mmetsp:Transcript_49433/g.80105  ORF Transcript_49433/g.80105 Transcript_49433/m.80105 type:complete len:209 (+) Transcript_49433:536-1162(+)